MIESAALVDSAAGMPTPDFVLPGGRGAGYGLFLLDPPSRAWLVERLPEVADKLLWGTDWPGPMVPGMRENLDAFLGLDLSEDVAIGLRLAELLEEAGRHDQALDVLEPAKRMYPTYVGVWVELGEANLRAGNPERAIEALREAARINPFDPRVHELSAEAYGEMGNEEEADRARKFAKLVQ
jgi:tetratricopeptide (TPR) repeat protein